MRVELHFKTPEEEEELKAALKGSEYLSRLIDIDNYARNSIKHMNIPEELKDQLRHIRHLVGEIWDC